VIALLLASGWVFVVGVVMRHSIGRMVLRRGQRRAILREGRRFRWLHRVPVFRRGIEIGSALRRTVHRRRDNRRTILELPAAVDLIAVGVGAGASLLHSIQLVCKWAHPNVGAEFAPVVRRVEMGVLLSDSLAYPSQSPTEVRAVFDALAASVRLGTAVQPTLVRLARDARLRELRAAAAHARTLPVRLIFPLVLLVLPAFVLLTVVPSLVAGWHSL
jgi:Flp pilus assembly protein TadB